jgi:hypothetical protein
MKYVPIWVPVILILGVIAVRVYRPPVLASSNIPSLAGACSTSSDCRR